MVRQFAGEPRKQSDFANAHYWEQGLFAVLPKIGAAIASPERIKAGLTFVRDDYHANGVTLAAEPGGLLSKPLPNAQNAVLGDACSRRHHRQDHRTVLVHFAVSRPEQVARIRRLGAIVSGNPYYPVALADTYRIQGLGPERADVMVRMGDVERAGTSFSAGPWGARSGPLMATGTPARWRNGWPWLPVQRSAPPLGAPSPGPGHGLRPVQHELSPGPA